MKLKWKHNQDLNTNMHNKYESGYIPNLIFSYVNISERNLSKQTSEKSELTNGSKLGLPFCRAST